jgi:autophagy-related protein 9
LAEWKIRDFNEVSHLFDRRKRMVYAFANRYLDQFPKDKTNQLLRFAAFVMGSLAAILGVVTLVDPDLFLGFEISGKTSLFWLSIFSTLAVLCRNAATDEDDDLWDPEVAMNAVIVHSHYYPDSWKGRLHSDEVRQEFSSMYKLEALLFLEDIIGTLLTPWLLMYNLPSRADRLVDFFREFTIHVDGLGTVCSYAVFDFKNGGKAASRPGQAGDLRDGYYGDKANKLMESYLSFLDVYGPNPKRGLHGRSKRHFHPPPTFPGLAGNSPSVVAEHHSGSAIARHGTTLMRHSTVQPPSQPQQNTPRFGPAGSGHHISPMHSILLDPHHQPRSSPRQGPSARPPVRSGGGAAGASLRHTLEGDPAEVVEEDEELAAQNLPNIPRTSSNLIEEDSELGDSWLLRGGLAEENEANLSGGERERDRDRRGERGGVLGMLRELQKAQTEDRGGHI